MFANDHQVFPENEPVGPAKIAFYGHVTCTEKETLDFNNVKAMQVTVREYTTNKSESSSCPKCTESELHF